MRHRALERARGARGAATRGTPRCRRDASRRETIAARRRPRRERGIGRRRRVGGQRAPRPSARTIVRSCGRARRRGARRRKARRQPRARPPRRILLIRSGRAARLRPLPVPPWLRIALVHPDLRLTTADAPVVLPDSVDRATAIAQAAPSRRWSPRSALGRSVVAARRRRRSHRRAGARAAPSRLRRREACRARRGRARMLDLRRRTVVVRAGRRRRRRCTRRWPRCSRRIDAAASAAIGRVASVDERGARLEEAHVTSAVTSVSGVRSLPDRIDELDRAASVCPRAAVCSSSSTRSRRRDRRLRALRRSASARRAARTHPASGDIASSCFRRRATTTIVTHPEGNTPLLDVARRVAELDGIPRTCY